MVAMTRNMREMIHGSFRAASVSNGPWGLWKHMPCFLQSLASDGMTYFLGGLWLQNDFRKWAHCTSQCHDLLKWIYIKCLGGNPERTLSPSDVTKKSLSLSMSQVMWSTGPRFPWPFLVLALKLPHPRKPCSPEQTHSGSDSPTSRDRHV